MTTQRCIEPGCRRTVPYTGHARCEEHRLRWVPEWVRRAQEKALPAKELAA